MVRSQVAPCAISRRAVATSHRARQNKAMSIGSKSTGAYPAGFVAHLRDDGTGTARRLMRDLGVPELPW